MDKYIIGRYVNEEREYKYMEFIEDEVDVIIFDSLLDAKYEVDHLRREDLDMIVFFKLEEIK